MFFVRSRPFATPSSSLPTSRRRSGAEDGLAEHVGEQRLLLLLDNLEQVLDAAPALAELLERSPNLSLLVTSREPLRIAGEHEYPVEPLPEDEAVALFRAGARRRGAARGRATQICRRLDGLPLAIELAAARVRACCPPEQLLARLEQRAAAADRRRARRARAAADPAGDDRLELRPARRRRAALFARLAVFAGGFTLEAAEEVCDADLDTLESLARPEPVRRWASGRLGMLETIREFADELLDESGEGERVRRAHAEFFLALGESSGLRIDRLGTTPQRHDLVLPELHNFRATMDWAAANDPVAGATRGCLDRKHLGHARPPRRDRPFRDAPRAGY